MHRGLRGGESKTRGRVISTTRVPRPASSVHAIDGQVASIEVCEPEATKLRSSDLGTPSASDVRRLGRNPPEGTFMSVLKSRAAAASFALLSLAGCSSTTDGPDDGVHPGEAATSEAAQTSTETSYVCLAVGTTQAIAFCRSAVSCAATAASFCTCDGGKRCVMVVRNVGRAVERAIGDPDCPGETRPHVVERVGQQTCETCWGSGRRITCW